MSIDIIITGCAILAGVCLVVWMIILERRGTIPGKPRLLPTTPILFFAILVLVLALAHLVTLTTGSPHVGRMR